ncbi:MAG: hypothetical protein IMZ50_06130 [Candidatus Atribacteria bacterium]|nr:hypothetical protein [Candidatus Atribacteria bacterium]
MDSRRRNASAVVFAPSGAHLPEAPAARFIIHDAPAGAAHVQLTPAGRCLPFAQVSPSFSWARRALPDAGSPPGWRLSARFEYITGNGVQHDRNPYSAIRGFAANLRELTHQYIVSPRFVKWENLPNERPFDAR